MYEQSATGSWGAHVKGLPGSCVATGQTREECERHTSLTAQGHRNDTHDLAQTGGAPGMGATSAGRRSANTRCWHVDTGQRKRRTCRCPRTA
jgi:predicted RNase H-like HicB family nuclease